MFDDIISKKERLKWTWFEYRHKCVECGIVFQAEDNEKLHEQVRFHYLLMHSCEPPTTMEIDVILVEDKNGILEIFDILETEVENG
jgi:hypothetical protein